MPFGFVEALKQHLSVLTLTNYPGTKITPQNFLKALLINNPRLNVSGVNGERIDPLKLNTVDGSIREVKVKYLPRRTAEDVTEEDTCETTYINQYRESEILAPRFAKVGFFVDIATMRRYEAAAIQAMNIGDPNITVLNEMWTQILHSVNALISKIDQRIIGDVVFGVNAVTQNNAVKTININKDGQVYDLTAGLLEIANDYQHNEGTGRAMIVGNGLFNRFAIAKGSTVANAGGINVANLFDYDWFLDLNTNAQWGTNEIGVFFPGTIGFVDVDKYINPLRGRHGTSEFGMLPLPVETVFGGVPVMTRFNLQIREVDCPSEHISNYTTTSTGRGYEIYISKNYGLWQMPIDAYSDVDRMKGFNGALNYLITNNCDGCPE